MYNPIFYEQANLYEGLQSPSTYKSRSNASFWFWFRQLYLRVMGNIDFDFNNKFLPNVEDYLIFVLLIRGFLGFAKSNDVGLFGQMCGLTGYTFYFQPAKFIVTNPMWENSKEFEIGNTGALVRCMPDYMGIYDILTYYAEKLSNMDNSIDMSIINSKFAYILGANSKSGIHALKTMVDKINRGDTSVFFDKRITPTKDGQTFEYIELFSKDKYILDLLLADRETLLNDFDTEIGIKSLPYNKKERLTADESNIKEEDAKTKLNVMIETINDDFRVVNELFGVNFSCKQFSKEDVKDGDI